MSELWKVEKSEEHWLEAVDPEGWYKASVRWDGCIHFNRYYNNPLDDPGREEDDQDYIHICDIDSEIKRLQELKEIALKHFGPDWPNI